VGKTNAHNISTSSTFVGIGFALDAPTLPVPKEADA
jgi:hypothetical protein